MIFKTTLVKRELSNIAGLLVVRGGRLVALGSALFQVVRHIKFNRESENENEPAGDRDAVGLSPESGGANQNLLETKGSDANKIEAESK